MLAFLDKLLSAGRHTSTSWKSPVGLECLWGDCLLGRAAPRPVGVRPELEHLEERAVPSATTISAVTDPTHNQVVYVVGDGNHVWSHDNSGWHYVGGVVYNDYPTVSASVSPSGTAEVFVVGTDHGLWKYDGSWHSYAGYVTRISANLHDVCYVMDGNGAPWKLDSAGWHYLGGYVTDISAGQWTVLTPSGWTTIDELWGTDGWGHVWRNDGSDASAWVNLGGWASSLAATTNGSCFVMGGGSVLWEFDRTNFWQRYAPLPFGPADSGTASFATGVVGYHARNTDEAFAITYSGFSIWEYGIHSGDIVSWTGYDGSAVRIAGNRFDGDVHDTAGTANRVFYVVDANGTTWAHDTGGWHNYGGWTRTDLGLLPRWGS
jgi:hypothetical protein